MASGTPKWLKEIVIIGVWGTAAANVFIYTGETAIKMYKRPPLSAWKMGPTSQGSSANENGSGKGTFLEGLGQSLSKAIEGAGEAVGKVGVKGGALPGNKGLKAPNPTTAFKHVKVVKLTKKLENEILNLNQELGKQGQHLTEKTLHELAEGAVTVEQLRQKYVRRQTIKRITV